MKPLLRRLAQTSCTLSDRRQPICSLYTHRKRHLLLPPDGSEATSYYGIPLRRINGANACEVDQAAAETTAAIRRGEGPQILIFNVERLESHTNADDQSVYRSASDLEQA